MKAVSVELDRRTAVLTEAANRLAALKIVAAEAERIRAAYRQDIVSWGEDRFYIERSPGVIGPIQFARFQKALLRYIFTPDENGKYRFTTVLWSCPKKSGKTAVAALVARWAAENWGKFGEVYCLANDFDQAKSRAFAAICNSIELDPRYIPGKRYIQGEWQQYDRSLIHLPSKSAIKALASDYKGEAGANPSLTVWTELWGYVHEASRRLWTELTPSPARPYSLRWVETYAGFEGESDLLETLYKTGMAGRQLTAGEIGDLSAFEEAPNHDSLIPAWVNPEAGLFMYWDSGDIAHRMEWQRGESGDQYYREQAHILLPQEYERIHHNMWSSGSLGGIPIEWWDACVDPHPLIPGERTPLVVGIDASIDGDCTALNIVSRDPNDKTRVFQRYCRAWTPHGQPLDYDKTITPEVQRLIREYNIVQVTYDEYQLYHWANLRRKDNRPAWYNKFGQGEPRLLADKQLYDMIRDRRISHLGDPEQREHCLNVAIKPASADADTKLRFIKKASTRKIDLKVSLSMAAYECLRLNL